VVVVQGDLLANPSSSSKITVAVAAEVVGTTGTTTGTVMVAMMRVASMIIMATKATMKDMTRVTEGATEGGGEIREWA